MVKFADDQLEQPLPKKETWEEFNAKMNRIQMALAKREAIAENILAKYPTDRRRKTQEEIDADDALWFSTPAGNQPLNTDPAFAKYLKPAAERSQKTLRDKMLPSKDLRAGKARDAEEKAASAKRTMAASSDEDEGRTALGKAKKLKTKHNRTNGGEEDKPGGALINKALLAQNQVEEGKELVNKAVLLQLEDADESTEVTSKKSKKKKRKKSKQKNALAEEDDEQSDMENKSPEAVDQMDVDEEDFNLFRSKPIDANPKDNLPTDTEEAYEGEPETEQASDEERKARQEAKKLLKAMRKKEQKDKRREERSKMNVDVED
ncbi:hypothetical protein SBOR_7565 [Sclerotinia borealis F-4128]|uniref:Uncharacterized protein n=1 Tax=Sclerotinia borealis (strain F-4128) TaxID=1432307 RepID=W9CBW4_SCLBF|nr:hypothetical protein SBOR_7565 [Sclerotinia borealis F-4128]